LDLGARKILIVDDVRFTRLTLAKIIGSFGAPTILEAGDGESALAVLQHEGAGTDCIITDLDMPKLDGVGLLQAVRTGRGNVPRDTKVVLLTGHSELDRIGPALHFDVDAFLAKPASHRAIEACFQRLFGTPPASPASEADHAIPPNGPIAQTMPGSAGEGERMVAVPEIPADAELARDLLFGNGRLLLAAGARLSPRTRDSVGELLMIAGLPAQVWIRTAK
jgi:two-component system chemotaxis response regulator CheY